jgi:redox-sensitive bicupin YhaK (pirin superfamily)
VLIHQDASVHAALLDGAERIVHKLAPARKAYVHVARGSLTANGQTLQAGDALKASGVAELVLEQGEQAEIILFDLA